MGIISPKKLSRSAKALIIFLAILLSPILFFALLLYMMWGFILYMAIWLTGKRQFVVFVYSNSPTWQTYIEKEMLPFVRNHAIILNWSERQKWGNSLPVLAFRYFAGDRNFNPIALVFRRFHFVKIYRFYEAFKQFKHGHSEPVEQVKEELFRALGI